MSNLKVEIGARIAEIRKKNRDTQETTAKKLGIKRGTLAAYELGTSAMPDEIKNKFVKIYNISYEYLISGNEQRLVSEPPAEYSKRDILSLLGQLENTELANELREHVLQLIHQNAELKGKVIRLMEEKDQLINKQKKSS